MGNAQPRAPLAVRWRTALALVAWFAEFVVLSFALVFIVGAEAVAGTLADSSLLKRIAIELGSALPVVVSLLALVATWGVPSFTEVGLRWASGGPGRAYILRDIAFGLLLGPAAVGVFLLAGLIGGWDQVSGVAPPGTLLANLALGAVLFLCVAVFEELSGRGCLFALMARVLGIPAAFVVSVLVFALLHRANPGATPTALAGVGLAGVVFAFALLRTGLLWLPIAFHLSWDWAETSLYGFPDSGLPPASALQLNVDRTAPEWATGGAFGPEASVFVVLALLLAAGAIWWYTRGRPGRAILFPTGAPVRADATVPATAEQIRV